MTVQASVIKQKLSRKIVKKAYLRQSIHMAIFLSKRLYSPTLLLL